LRVFFTGTTIGMDGMSSYTISAWAWRRDMTAVPLLVPSGAPCSLPSVPLRLADYALAMQSLGHNVTMLQSVCREEGRSVPVHPMVPSGGTCISTRCCTRLPGVAIPCMSPALGTLGVEALWTPHHTSVGVSHMQP
jgi:hypothetical protein